MISPGGRPINEAPLSSSKTDNWVAKAGGLPPYVRGIARAIARKHGGKVTSADIAMAIAATRKWQAKSKVAAVKAASGAAQADWAAKRAKSHNLSVVDLAASSAHHHIAGTSYHWHHGWQPLDRATAARYGKDTKGLTDFHEIEPEEFNGYDNMPKYVGSAKFGGPVDEQPVMKYKTNKALTGKTFKDSKGNTVKVAKVSASNTHVLGEDGRKTRISELKGNDAAISAFKKNQFKTATRTYKIKSGFKKTKYTPLPIGPKAPAEKTPSWSKVPIGKTYSAPAGFEEPRFPKNRPLQTPNLATPLTGAEKAQLVNYTGASYAGLNSALRTGKTEGYEAKIKNMDSALAKAAPLPKSQILHRGFSVAALSQLQPGDSFVEKAYSSTSRRSNLGLAARSTRLHIESMDPALKALDVNGISQHPNEHEVILPRNTKYTVKRRVDHGAHTHMYVHAEPAKPEDM